MVVVDAESWGEYITLSKRHPNSDHGVSLSFAFAVNKMQEDVITGKPEASKTFLIKWKTTHDRFWNQWL